MAGTEGNGPAAGTTGATGATGAAGTTGTGGTSGSGGAAGTTGTTGGATGIGPGSAIGIPAMSATGAAGGAHTSPLPWKHPCPGAAGGAADAIGLDAMATPQSPAATTTTRVLNRSKLAIDVAPPSVVC